MIKLVASDLDGTLLFKGAQSLPEEIFPLIRQLKKMGILFVAASGRQYANMKKMFRPVVDDMAVYQRKWRSLQCIMKKFFIRTVLNRSWSVKSQKIFMTKKDQNLPVPRKIFTISDRKQNISEI